MGRVRPRPYGVRRASRHREDRLSDDEASHRVVPSGPSGPRLPASGRVPSAEPEPTPRVNGTCRFRDNSMSTPTSAAVDPGSSTYELVGAGVFRTMAWRTPCPRTWWTPAGVVSVLDVGSSARHAAEWDGPSAALSVTELVETTSTHVARARQVQRLLAGHHLRGRKVPDPSWTEAEAWGEG